MNEGRLKVNILWNRWANAERKDEQTYRVTFDGNRLKLL